MGQKTVTITRTVERWRTTQCTACSTDFAYLQTLVGKGILTTGFLNGGEASCEVKADKIAREELRKKVESDAHSATACPVCGSYNQDMLVEASATRARRITKYVGIVLAVIWVIGFLGPIIYMATNLRSSTKAPGQVLSAVFMYYTPAVLLGVPVLYMVLRRQDINTPARKLKRTAKRENKSKLRPEFDEMVEEMDEEDQEQSLSMVRWPS